MKYVFLIAVTLYYYKQDLGGIYGNKMDFNVDSFLCSTFL